MLNENKQLKKLYILLNQFFDKDQEIPEDILLLSYRFLFKNGNFPETRKKSELYNTLLYLKDVMERNYLKDIENLIQYYKQKQRGIDDMFDSYVQSKAEELLADTFRSSLESHLRIFDMENHVKSESLYYPISETPYLIGYENISYRNSVEEEILYLAKIKGNQLISQKNVSRVLSEKNKQLISN